MAESVVGVGHGGVLVVDWTSGAGGSSSVITVGAELEVVSWLTLPRLLLSGFMLCFMSCVRGGRASRGGAVGLSLRFAASRMGIAAVLSLHLACGTSLVAGSRCVLACSSLAPGCAAAKKRGSRAASVGVGLLVSGARTPTVRGLFEAFASIPPTLASLTSLGP